MPGRSETDARPATDALTGAMTRGALQACLDDALGNAARAGGFCSVFMFDVDHFKTVNDAYGHARGDAVLRLIAERTMQLRRQGDVLVRYGGDEFVLVLPGTGRRDAMQVATRLVNGIKDEPFPGSPPLSVSVSLGLATFPDDTASPGELLEIADRRNYLAKRRGRGRAVGDDLAATTAGSSGRLLERDAALAQAQGFLVRLDVEARGTLRVTGPAGAGHSRFLAEVTKLAGMRGFEVCRVDDQIPDRDQTPGAQRVLVVADTDADPDVIDKVVRGIVEADPAPAVVGVLHALVEPGDRPSLLPLTGTVVLAPLSSVSLHVWLRTALRGEPSPPLIDWLAGRSGGGLIARVERELARLADGGHLEQGEHGGWTVSATRLARTAQARRRLPAAVSTLVGRERDISRVVELLADRRLVTLAGAGGIGKTRLAMAVAIAIADEFDDGAVFVPLAETTTTELVVSALAEMLDVAEVSGEKLSDTVIRDLSDRDLLLVLDNFEQVLDAGPFVARVLAAAPGVKALVTSRQRLRLSGEQVYPVPPLPLPDLDQLPVRAEDVAAAVATSGALALFVSRANEAAYDLRFTPADLRAAATVCHRLDGLPLAIELAAAGCDVLTPAEIHAQLDERLGLTEGPQDLPARQRTLRATIDWSFALLDADDQDLMRQLAVFVGGCPADAVAAVWLPPGIPAVDRHVAGRPLAERLAGLVDKNLLGTASTPAGTRYMMLETIRAFAAERLAGSAVETDVHDRHATYFASFADQAGREMTGPGQADWHRHIIREYPNLRAAFNWAERVGTALVAARIAAGLSRFWVSGRHLGEGREWYDRLLADPRRLPDGIRSKLFHQAGFLAVMQDDYSVALQLGGDSLRLARQLDDPANTAEALNVLGIAARHTRDYEQAGTWLRKAMAIQAERGDRRGVAAARGNLTQVAIALGDLDIGEKLALLNLDLEREIGNLRGVSMTLEILGELRIKRGDVAGARVLLNESLQIHQRTGNMFGEASANLSLGLAARGDGNSAEAYQQFAVAARISHRVGDRDLLITALVELADLLRATDPTRATRLLGTAEAVRERCGEPMTGEERTQRDGIRDRLRARLGETDLAAAWAAGRVIPLDEVIDDLFAVAPTIAS